MKRLSTQPTSIFEQEDPFPDILVTYYVEVDNTCAAVVLETVKKYMKYVEIPIKDLKKFVKHVKENTKELGK